MRFQTSNSVAATKLIPKSICSFYFLCSYLGMSSDDQSLLRICRIMRNACCFWAILPSKSCKNAYYLA